MLLYYIYYIIFIILYLLYLLYLLVPSPREGSAASPDSAVSSRIWITILEAPPRRLFRRLFRAPRGEGTIVVGKPPTGKARREPVKSGRRLRSCKARPGYSTQLNKPATLSHIQALPEGSLAPLYYVLLLFPQIFVY